jgi:isoleucyl-tRNA synthetase
MRCERITAMFECHALWTSQRHRTMAKSQTSTFSLPEFLLHRKETMAFKFRHGEWASKSLKATHHLDCWFDCASMTAAHVIFALLSLIS